jgi:hypothetical protein
MEAALENDVSQLPGGLFWGWIAAFEAKECVVDAGEVVVRLCNNFRCFGGATYIFTGFFGARTPKCCQRSLPKLNIV